MKLIRTIWLILFVAGLAVSGRGQDLHFSQFMNSPLSTNPANTGFIPDGDYRLGVNYRNQWSAIMTLPYKTMSAFGDVQLMKNQIETGWLGAGMLILHDVAGSGNLTSSKVYGSVAYHQMLGYSSLLSAGFNVGWAGKRINTTNLKFPDQFDGKFFDNKLPTAVQLDNTSVNYLDLQLGLNYAYFPTEAIYVNAGYSAMHVNRARESFFNATAGVDNRISVRHNAFVNASFMLNDQWILNPNIYFSTQARASEIVGGLNAQYNLSGDGEQQLIGGVYYRHQDAVIPMIGIQWKDIRATFTYDATISTLKNYNNTRGAFEFSLIKQGVLNSFSGGEKRSFKCPSFRL